MPALHLSLNSVPSVLNRHARCWPNSHCNRLCGEGRIRHFACHDHSVYAVLLVLIRLGKKWTAPHKCCFLSQVAQHPAQKWLLSWSSARPGTHLSLQSSVICLEPAWNLPPAVFPAASVRSYLGLPLPGGGIGLTQEGGRMGLTQAPLLRSCLPEGSVNLKDLWGLCHVMHEMVLFSFLSLFL